MKAYHPRLNKIRAMQGRFVADLLGHTLPAGNVLYCMNNETSSEAGWGRHWMAFIHRHAAAAGVKVFCTDTFDNAFRPEETAALAEVLVRPDLYDFIDISTLGWAAHPLDL